MIDILNQIETILCGIDKTETEHDNGWWETSSGATFGKDRLRKIEALFLDNVEETTEGKRGNGMGSGLA